ncbi:MAG: potassium channel family protein [Actinomycetota bacterium]|nr:potassium channel family protein [Actinomycetota bacterium]
MDERSRRVEKALEIPILVAALLVIPVIAIEQSDAAGAWRTAAGVLNWAIWLAFAAEVVIMLAVVPDKWRWLRHHPLEVAIVVLTPPFLPESLQAARLLRLLRVLRLVRLVGLARRVFSLEGVRYVGVLAVVTALGGGAALNAVEPRVESTWDGVWWAVVTMTTVGYGDVTPESVPGRLISFGVMIVGIGFTALLTAALAERFVASRVSETEEQVTERIGDAEADVVAELREVTERLHRLEQRLGQGA